MLALCGAALRDGCVVGGADVMIDSVLKLVWAALAGGDGGSGATASGGYDTREIQDAALTALPASFAVLVASEHGHFVADYDDSLWRGPGAVGRVKNLNMTMDELTTDKCTWKTCLKL